MKFKPLVIVNEGKVKDDFKMCTEEGRAYVLYKIDGDYHYADKDKEEELTEIYNRISFFCDNFRDIGRNMFYGDCRDKISLYTCQSILNDMMLFPFKFKLISSDEYFELEINSKSLFTMHKCKKNGGVIYDEVCLKEDVYKAFDGLDDISMTLVKYRNLHSIIQSDPYYMPKNDFESEFIDRYCEILKKINRELYRKYIVINRKQYREVLQTMEVLGFKLRGERPTECTDLEVLGLKEEKETILEIHSWGGISGRGTKWYNEKHKEEVTLEELKSFITICDVRRYRIEFKKASEEREKEEREKEQARLDKIEEERIEKEYREYWDEAYKEFKREQRLKGGFGDSKGYAEYSRAVDKAWGVY